MIIVAFGLVPASVERTQKSWVSQNVEGAMMTYANAAPMYKQWKRRKWLFIILGITLLISSWYLLNCKTPLFGELFNEYRRDPLYAFLIRVIIIPLFVLTLLFPLSFLLQRCPKCNTWRPTNEQVYWVGARRERELLSCKSCGIRLNTPPPPVHFSARRIALGVLLGLCCGVPLLFYVIYSLGKLACP